MKLPKTITTILLILLSFLLGRASQKTTQKVIYTKGKEVKASPIIPHPTKVITPSKPILPYKYIYINHIETEVVDTAKIINDYIAENSYSMTLFDNLHGKLEITPIVQYNQLTAIPYTFTPIEKTVFAKQKWTFFATASYNSFHIAGVGAAVYRKNVGIHYKYLWSTHLHTRGHELGVGILF